MIKVLSLFFNNARTAWCTTLNCKFKFVIDCFQIMLLTLLILNQSSIISSQNHITPFMFLTNVKKYPIQKIEFDPDEGLRNRGFFEEKYGKRGERLIASFGGLPSHYYSQ